MLRVRQHPQLFPQSGNEKLRAEVGAPPAASVAWRISVPSASRAACISRMSGRMSISRSPDLVRLVIGIGAAPGANSASTASASTDAAEGSETVTV